MKKTIIILSVLSIIILISGCEKLPQLSQPEIGILDMELVLDQSKRARQLTEELSEIGSGLEKDYEKERQEEDKEELDRIYQQFLNNKKRVEDKLNDEVKNVLKEISKEENLGIVLYKKSVRVGGIDITDKTIELLDKTYFEGGAADEKKGSS